MIDVFENAADYEALAAAISADFRPATNFELQLIGRLTSLLWRLRRATAIESGLLALEAKNHPTPSEADLQKKLAVFYDFIPALARDPQYISPVGETAKVAGSYRRLSLRDGKAFERLRRYETSLWRQTAQLILLLNAINRGVSAREAFGRKANRTLWPPLSDYAGER